MGSKISSELLKKRISQRRGFKGGLSLRHQSEVGPGQTYEKCGRALYRGDDAFCAFAHIVSVPLVKGKSGRYAWAPSEWKPPGLRGCLQRNPVFFGVPVVLCGSDTPR